MKYLKLILWLHRNIIERIKKDNTNLIAKKICDMDKVSKISLEIDLNKKGKKRGKNPVFSFFWRRKSLDLVFKSVIIINKAEFSAK